MMHKIARGVAVEESHLQRGLAYTAALRSGLVARRAIHLIMLH